VSKFTLADRLRDLADKIEKLPEDDDISVDVKSFFQKDEAEISRALSLAEGCESSIGHNGGTNWVEFRNIHGEPLTVTVYYKPDVLTQGENQ
jgi:hypothetical protein